MRKFSVKIEGREIEVELDDEGVAHVGEREIAVVEAEAGVYLLRVGSEQTLVRVDGNGAKLGVVVRRGGELIGVSAEVEDAVRARIAVPARPGGEPGAPVSIRSPIPGRVVKVLVKAGDPVKAEQTVVVLEAMKMENELRAPRAGTILEIRCAEGTAVEAGQDLVSMR